MAGPGAVGGVEQPFVGAEILVQPDGVVEAGALEAGRRPVDAVRQHTGAEQRHVRRVGEDRAVHRGIVADGGDGAEPAVLDRLGRRRVEPLARIDGADLDRARARDHPALLFGQVHRVLLAQFRLGRQRFGRGHVGHAILVVEAVLRHLQRAGKIEDRGAALHRDDAAGGEAAAFEIAHDAVDDREILVPRPHEIGVERMSHLWRVGRALRRLERLRDHLAAEDAADAALRPAAAIEIGVDFLNVEQINEIGGQSLGGGGNARVVRGVAHLIRSLCLPRWGRQAGRPWITPGTPVATCP